MTAPDPIKSAIRDLSGLTERERDLLAWFATENGGGPVTATRGEIAMATGINESYVIKLVHRLTRKELVKITGRVETYYVGQASVYEVSSQHFNSGLDGEFCFS